MARSFSKILLVGALAISAGGCSTVHQVPYFDAVAAGPAIESDATSASSLPVTRIYIDANGSLYPRESLPPHGIPAAHWNGSLFDHFRSSEALCTGALPDGEIGALCVAKIAGREEALGQWYIAQEPMWMARGEAIVRKAVAASTNPEIIMLIHGFNNTMAEAAPNFAKARRLIAEAAPDPARLSVVEVYWDGCTVPGGVGCWAKAQGSGPLAGFSLRQLFNSIDQSLERRGLPSRIRVVAHSSGAFVVGAALGNPGRVLPDLLKRANFEYARFADHALDREGPHAIPAIDDLRLAMFAPATPTATFTGKETGEGLQARDVRLLYTIQSNDKVLKKSAFGVTLKCARLGVTCMGLLPASHCREIGPSDHLRAIGTRAVAYDYTRKQSDWGDLFDEHGFGIYLDQASRPGNSILADLMGQGSSEGVGAVRCTG